MRVISLLTVLLATIALGYALPAGGDNDHDTEVNEFDLLEPSHELNWTTCYGSHVCTRLIVPLDYEDESAGTTDIAIIKRFPPISKPAPPQEIVLNPGGPGGSAVDMVLRSAEKLLKRIGPEYTHYTLVGIDPRGVKNSGPDISCFENKGDEELWWASFGDFAVDTSDERALGELYAKVKSYGRRCSEVHREGKGRYVTTAATAQDIARYYEVQAKANESNDPKAAKIWFLGASYGTVLGQTLATLFPDRIERIVLDSVADTDSYYNGTYLSFLADTTAVMQDFFTACHEAGPKNCAMYEPSPAEIETRLKDLINCIRERPVPVYADSTLFSYPAIVDYKRLTVFLMRQLYNQTSFPKMAASLHALEQGDGTKVAADVERLDRDSDKLGFWGTVSHIKCLDAAGRGQIKNFDEFVARAHEFHDEAPWVGDAWFLDAAAWCTGRDYRPPQSQIMNATGANMSTHILFMTQELDPATARQDAYISSAKFPGSVVLENKGHGHIAPKSECLDEHLRRYFESGAVPSKNTVCDIEESLAANPFLISDLNPRFRG